SPRSNSSGSSLPPPAPPSVPVEFQRVDLLLRCAALGDVPGLRFLLESPDMPVEPSAPNLDGRTALHLAAVSGQVAAVRYLLLRGGKPDARDRWGYAPKDDALYSGHTQLAALFDAPQTARAAAPAPTPAPAPAAQLAQRIPLVRSAGAAPSALSAS